MLVYKKVMHFKKWSGFFGPPCIYDYAPRDCLGCKGCAI